MQHAVSTVFYTVSIIVLLACLPLSYASAYSYDYTVESKPRPPNDYTDTVSVSYWDFDDTTPSNLYGCLSHPAGCRVVLRAVSGTSTAVVPREIPGSAYVIPALDKEKTIGGEEENYWRQDFYIKNFLLRETPNTCAIN